jgi:hypothetical protein
VRDRFEASKIQEVIVRDSIVASRQSAADFFDNIGPNRTSRGCGNDRRWVTFQI